MLTHPASSPHAGLRMPITRLLRRVLAAVTCVSCGAEWGQPHKPSCEFETLSARRG